MSGRVSDWLRTLDLQDYAAVFEQQQVLFEDLPDLTETDLEKIGIPLGPRKRLLKAISSLSADRFEGSAPPERVDAARENLAAWERHPGERKPVTMLFADITGSTALTEKLDAEEAHELLYGATQLMCEAVEANRGTVCRFMGDGVMAMFGAPVALERHALDACEAALEMQALVHAYSADLESRHGVGLQIRVGLHSGEVVVLTVGEGDKVEYDASGPTVPIAARMEQLAEPGTIYLTASTRSLAGHGIETQTLAPASVKGITDPVAVFELRRVRTPEEAIVDVGHTPFVGRRTELNQFRGMMDACMEEGHGQAVYVRGDPGIGKTRLVQEFSRLAREKGMATYRSHLLPFGVGKGQDAVRSLVGALIGLPSASDEQERRRKLDQVLADAWIQPDQAVFLYDLLALPQPVVQRALYDAMDNATRNQGKQATVAALLATVARRRGALVIVEDVQWADVVTLAHLAALTKTVAECRALLVITSRIDGDQLDRTWRATTEGSPLTTIDLGPLRTQESIALISEFIDSDDSLAKSCLERAAGNPLFLEQLLSTPHEGAGANLPESIQSLVLARIDRLATSDKQALQAASVIGHRFGADVLRYLLDNEYDCRELIERNLVHREGDAYSFAHALIQEVVYGSLLKRQRRELHRKAAEWYASTEAALHAEHLARADDDRAPGAFLEAAREYAQHYHFQQALVLAEKGLAIVKEQAQRHRLACLKGELLHDLADVQSSVDAYQQVLENAEDDVQRCDAWLGLAAGMRMKTNYDRALEFVDRAESVARENNLTQQLSRIHHLRGNLLFPLGRPDECRAAHQIALDYARRATSIEDEARALGGLGDAEYARGRMQSAYDALHSCVKTCRANGFGRIEVANNAQMPHAALFLKPMDGVLEMGREAAAAAARVGHHRAEMNALGAICGASLELLELDLLNSSAERGLALAKKLKASAWEPTWIMQCAIVKLLRGETENAEKLAAQATTMPSSFRAPWDQGVLSMVTRNPETRKQALARGERLLAEGSIGSNHLHFYRFAMEACCQAADWVGLERFARALEVFTEREPLPWSDFMIARGRALARAGREGGAAGPCAGELRRLLELASSRGYRMSMQALEQALAG